MNKYLYIFRNTIEAETEFSNASPDEMQKEMEFWMTWMGKLREQGRLHGGEPLKTEGKVVRNSGELITDGPFAEGKEIVGGYLLVEAKDLNEATEMSKECPIFRNGGNVEVREIAAM